MLIRLLSGCTVAVAIWVALFLQVAPADTTFAASQPTISSATGTVTGKISPRNANYSIDVRLDTEQRKLEGREVLTWRNNSTLATSELQFHLYYNAWKNTKSTWMRARLRRRGQQFHDRPAADWGWIDVTAVRLLGEGTVSPIDLTDEVTYIAPDDGNPDDETVLLVPLPQPISPGNTIRVELEWTSRVPRTFARTGAISDYFFIAQWFPKIGVLENTGWNCHQFHAATEFFSDYGVYDVRITIPTGWVVGATGVVRDIAENTDGTTTHHYYQEDVHDFAWTTSPDFLDRLDRFEHPDLPDVEIRLLLQPEHAAQADRHFAATRNTLRYYGEWFGAYPYDHITVVDPAWQSRTGGMEYPTFFTAGSRWLAPINVGSPEEVTIHEAGHQFWYGVVGNNEFEDAWLDEGLNTFATARVMEASFAPHYRSTRFFGGFIPWVFPGIHWSREIDGNRLTGYRRNARMDSQATPTYRYWPGSASSISYNKTALWLHTLERYLGWAVLRQGMASFYDQWKFGHPSPDDFFRTLNEESGQDLSWFFDQVYGTANIFDYGLQELTSRPNSGRGFFHDDGESRFTHDVGGSGYETKVVVRRYGEGIFPIEVVTTFEDGHEEREQWNGETRWTAFTYQHEARATQALVDPKRILLLDVNYTNNSRTLAPKADAAATKWSVRWLIWLQDLLLTYGFFI